MFLLLLKKNDYIGIDKILKWGRFIDILPYKIDNF